MMFSAEGISAFVNSHPTVKDAGAFFPLLIGVSPVGDGLGLYIPKGYVSIREGVLGVRRNGESESQGPRREPRAFASAIHRRMNSV